MNNAQEKENKNSALPGFAALGLILTGLAGILHGFQFGTPLSLIASAMSFGLLFYVMFK